MTFHHSSALDFAATWNEFAQLVTDYASKQQLPNTVAEALNEVHTVIHEIELCQHEGHAPDHHDIPWRVGYLVFCMYQVERVGVGDESVRSLVAHFLDEMGVSFPCALDIALVRIRALSQGEDIVHVDTCVLVPLMQRHLHSRAS